MHGVTLRRLVRPTPTRPSATPSSTSRRSATAAMYKDGWWLAMKTAAHPVGAHAGGARAVRARASGTPTTTRPSSTTCPTTSPRPGTSPPSTPRRSQELKELFWEEAEKYKVLPLLGDAGDLLRHAAAARRTQPRSSSAATSRTSLSGMIPRIYNHSYTISADLVIPAGRRRGRDRRRGRPPGRVLAVRRRTASSPTPTR